MTICIYSLIYKINNTDKLKIEFIPLTKEFNNELPILPLPNNGFITFCCIFPNKFPNGFGVTT